MGFSRMKNAALALAMAATAGFGHAGVVVSTLDDFSTGFDSAPWNFIGSLDVGRFEFSSGGNILSAKLTGTFGNTLSNSSTEAAVFGDGVEVATCNLFEDCWFGADPLVSFSYTFSLADLALLQDGVFELTVDKRDTGAVHLGSLRLEITNDVPEPVSAALVLAGLAGLGWSRRRRSS